MSDTTLPQSWPLFSPAVMKQLKCACGRQVSTHTHRHSHTHTHSDAYRTGWGGKMRQLQEPQFPHPCCTHPCNKAAVLFSRFTNDGKLSLFQFLVCECGACEYVCVSVCACEPYYCGGTTFTCHFADRVHQVGGHNDVIKVHAHTHAHIRGASRTELPD